MAKKRPTSRPAAAAKKPAAATKKPAAAAKKPATKKPASKKPITRRGAPPTAIEAAPPTRARGRAASIDTLGAGDVLARIALFARAEDDIGEELVALVARLEQIAAPSLIPALFGMLDDDDPHGVLWSVFYLLEGFDDAYLDGLLTALPTLFEHAQGWAETAILRIANTKGEPEDCTAAFVALARRRPQTARRKLATLVGKVATHTEGLHANQRRGVAELAKAIAR